MYTIAEHWTTELFLNMKWPGKKHGRIVLQFNALGNRTKDIEYHI